MPHSTWTSVPQLVGIPPSGGNTKTIQFYYFTELTIGTGSVRTLLDKGKAGPADRRTEIIATELAKYKIDTAVLSKTRLAKEGFAGKGTGCSFFWNDRSNNEPREAAVTFTIKVNLVKNL